MAGSSAELKLARQLASQRGQRTLQTIAELLELAQFDRSITDPKIDLESRRHGCWCPRGLA